MLFTQHRSRDATRAILEQFLHLYFIVSKIVGMGNFALANSTNTDDQAYVTPMIHLATTLTTVPNAQTNKCIPVYAYHCRTLPQTLLEGLEHLGILHTAEISFIMNAASLWEYDETSPDAKTAALVGGHWAKFASTGNPGWEAFTSENGEMNVFSGGGASHYEDARELRKEYREFWEEHFVKKYAEA